MNPVVTLGTLHHLALVVIVFVTVQADWAVVPCMRKRDRMKRYDETPPAFETNVKVSAFAPLMPCTSVSKQYSEKTETPIKPEQKLLAIKQNYNCASV